MTAHIGHTAKKYIASSRNIGRANSISIIAVKSNSATKCFKSDWNRGCNLAVVSLRRIGSNIAIDGKAGSVYSKSNIWVKVNVIAACAIWHIIVAIPSNHATHRAHTSHIASQHARVYVIAGASNIVRI